MKNLCATIQILMISVFIFSITCETSGQHYDCTMVIGYSQCGRIPDGWYVAGTDSISDFEQVVDNDKWQLLWGGGGGVDKWMDPDYQAWNNAIISPCSKNSNSPDRILLSVSGPHGTDITKWVIDIDSTISTIRSKYPSVKEIILQPVVGGPSHQTCFNGVDSVRASWQHVYIDSAIAIVAANDTDVSAGCSPEVQACSDYTDAKGHLDSIAAAVIGTNIAACYTQNSISKKQDVFEYCMIYPNPTYGKVVIDIKNIKSIEIININGQTIYRSINKNLNTEVDISMKPAGMYFIKVITDKKTITRKLIKH